MACVEVPQWNVAWRARARGMIGSVTRKAAMAGVGFYSVASFYANPPRRTGIVLGYAPLHEREIREGIRRLAVALS
jgi:GntR family transcriptional regulator / MocR family aminotransferase